MRKNEIVLVLSMLILIVSCDGINNYDYLQVVIQWQPATCSDLNKPSCYQNPTNRFSIHGVWPSLFNRDIPQCFGSSFDVYQVSDLESDLSEIWPNVATGDNHWLWGHEWEMHGICSENIFDQQIYFWLGMYTYYEINLLFLLNNNQIIPNGEFYTSDQIYAAIRAGTGKTPAVRCNDNRVSEVKQLHEITICYNSDASEFVDCPPGANTCPTSFAWYSWNPM